MINRLWCRLGIVCNMIVHILPVVPPELVALLPLLLLPDCPHYFAIRLLLLDRMNPIYEMKIARHKQTNNNKTKHREITQKAYLMDVSYKNTYKQMEMN